MKEALSRQRRAWKRQNWELEMRENHSFETNLNLRRGLAGSLRRISVRRSSLLAMASAAEEIVLLMVSGLCSLPV